MYPKEYIEFLYHFHCDRDYFECHEILEHLWKLDPKDERKPGWVGLIQVAVSFYHYRRGNFRGAYRMMKNAISIIRKEKQFIETIGLDSGKLLNILEHSFEGIQQKKPYKSIQLPISDPALLEICFNTAKERKKTWGEKSDLSNQYLIHKHKKRDRSSIILERKASLKEKEKRRR